MEHLRDRFRYRPLLNQYKRGTTYPRSISLAMPTLYAI
jgi:hypothetical protein